MERVLKSCSDINFLIEKHSEIDCFAGNKIFFSESVQFYRMALSEITPLSNRDRLSEIVIFIGNLTKIRLSLVKIS